MNFYYIWATKRISLTIEWWYRFAYLMESCLKPYIPRNKLIHYILILKTGWQFINVREKHTTTIISQAKQRNTYCTCNRSLSAESKQVRKASRRTFILLFLVFNLMGKKSYWWKGKTKKHLKHFSCGNRKSDETSHSPSKHYTMVGSFTWLFHIAFYCWRDDYSVMHNVNGYFELHTWGIMIQVKYFKDRLVSSPAFLMGWSKK